MHRAVSTGIDGNSAAADEITESHPQRFPLRVAAFCSCAFPAQPLTPAITPVGLPTQAARHPAPLPRGSRQNKWHNARHFPASFSTKAGE